jgi:addiction module HigA family antidote
MSMATMYNPAHPGELLREYLRNLQVGEAAKRLHIARSTLSRLLNGHMSFTAAMALRLSDAFGTDPGVWLDLQQQYDLWHAAQRKRPKIKKFDFSDIDKKVAA